MNEPRDKEPMDERRFAERAKEVFDSSVERLDAATLSRLNQGRHAALEQLQSTRPSGLWVRWVPATGVAAAVVLTVLVMRGPDDVEPLTQHAGQPEAVADFELLLDEESLEMLEDLEFYSWLEAVDLDTDGNVG